MSWLENPPSVLSWFIHFTIFYQQEMAGKWQKAETSCIVSRCYQLRSQHHRKFDKAFVVDTWYVSKFSNTKAPDFPRDVLTDCLSSRSKIFTMIGGKGIVEAIWVRVFVSLRTHP